MGSIFANGVDLDNIFEPRGSFTKRADVGIYDNGVDISNKYAPVANGSPASATNIYSGTTTDIASLFAAAGSVAYLSAPWAGDLYQTSSTCSSTGGSCAGTSNFYFAFGSDGNFYVGTSYPPTSNQGSWLGAGGAVTDYEALVSADVGFIRNDYVSYSQITGTSKYVRSSLTQIAPAGEVVETNYTVTVTVRKISNTAQSVSSAFTLIHTHENFLSV